MFRDSAHTFVKLYARVKRIPPLAAFLASPIGREFFRKSYFLYKRYIEDSLKTLLKKTPASLRVVMP